MSYCEKCGTKTITASGWFDGLADPEPYEADVPEELREDDRDKSSVKGDENERML